MIRKFLEDYKNANKYLKRYFWFMTFMWAGLWITLINFVRAIHKSFSWISVFSLVVFIVLWVCTVKMVEYSTKRKLEMLR